MPGQLQKRTKSLSARLFKVAGKLKDDVSAKDVHRLRTTIRRIESLVNYAHPKLGRKQEKKLDLLKDLRKRGGKVRDLDIQMGLLGAIGNGSTRNDRQTLTEILKRKRAKQARRLASAVAKLDVSKLVSQLDKIAEKAAETPAGQSAGAPLEQARCELVALAAEPAFQRKLEPAQMHEARIKLKLIRYLAESASKSPEQQRFVADMKSVQDALGEWHDWEMLQGTAESQFGHRMNCALLMEIKSLYAVKHSAAISALTNFLSRFSVPHGRKQPASSRAARPAMLRA